MKTNQSRDTLELISSCMKNTCKNAAHHERIAFVVIASIQPEVDEGLRSDGPRKPAEREDAVGGFLGWTRLGTYTAETRAPTRMAPMVSLALAIAHRGRSGEREGVGSRRRGGRGDDGGEEEKGEGAGSMAELMRSGDEQGRTGRR